MRMLCPAFFGREDLDCLVFRTDRVKELLRIFDRHDPVVRAVSDEKILNGGQFLNPNQQSN